MKLNSIVAIVYSVPITKRVNIRYLRNVLALAPLFVILAQYASDISDKYIGGYKYFIMGFSTIVSGIISYVTLEDSDRLEMELKNVKARLSIAESKLAKHDERHDKSDERHDKSDERHDKSNERLSQHDERLSQHDERHDKSDERHDKSDERLSQHDALHATNNVNHETLNYRLDDLYIRMNDNSSYDGMVDINSDDE